MKGDRITIIWLELYIFRLEGIFSNLVQINIYIWEGGAKWVNYEKKCLNAQFFVVPCQVFAFNLLFIKNKKIEKSWAKWAPKKSNHAIFQSFL